MNLADVLLILVQFSVYFVQPYLKDTLCYSSLYPGSHCPSILSCFHNLERQMPWEVGSKVINSEGPRTVHCFEQ